MLDLPAVANANTHFYVDNAPPEEVAWVLRCLLPEEPLSPNDIASLLRSEYGFSMQKDKTYSPRRLHDLGLARQAKVGGKVCYFLTPLGRKVRSMTTTESALYPDIMHFLHYSGFDGRSETRKYLWSYRRCCEIVWAEKRLIPTQEMASRVQALMRTEFPDLDFGAAKGARFDSTGAGRCYTWMKSLSPPAFSDSDGILQPRSVDRHELPLLALSYVYRERHYRHGDPVLLDKVVLSDVAAVFFLDTVRCRDLLSLAVQTTRALQLADTFAGTCVTLASAYGIENI